MTPPTETEQLASLAALSGTHAELPEPGLQRDLLRLRMIAEAQRRGVTWAQIGRVLGLPDGKAAKRAAKRLAKLTQARLLRQEG